MDDNFQTNAKLVQKTIGNSGGILHLLYQPDESLSATQSWPHLLHQYATAAQQMSNICDIFVPSCVVVPCNPKEVSTTHASIVEVPELLRTTLQEEEAGSLIVPDISFDDSLQHDEDLDKHNENMTAVSTNFEEIRNKIRNEHRTTRRR